MLEAVQAVKAQVPDAFVLVSFAVLPDGYTREGMYSKDLVRRMTESGIVDAVGFNCVSAPGAMRALVQQLGEHGSAACSDAQRGLPGGHTHPGAVSGQAGILCKRAGPPCCRGCAHPGRLLRHYSGSHCRPACGTGCLAGNTACSPGSAVSTPEAEVEKDDAFLRKLNAGKKVIAIELDSPKDADLSNYLAGASACRPQEQIC